MRRLAWGAIGTAVLVASGSCAISQQQEVAMGNEYSTQIAEQLPLLSDAQVVRYVTTLGERLANATDTRGLAWHFAIVNSKEVNAFAVPGGWIYVNRGLIERAENMSQLAGVLAHEIGHVTRRHTVEQMQQSQSANIGVTLACTLTGACGSDASQAAINLGGSALFAKFSRADEAEADAEAVATTIKAGISPTGIPAMFRLLLAERKRSPGALEGFFLTHPLAEDRIEATEALIAGHSSAELRNLARDATAFQTIRRRLKSLPAPPK
jgi:predicted Zn-dependent protease